MSSKLKNRKRHGRWVSSFVASLIAVLACSVGNGPKEHTLTLKISPRTHDAKLAVPSSTSDMECLFVNVTGTGVTETFSGTNSKLRGYAASCLGLGTVSKLVDISTGEKTLSLKVTPGTRTIDIIGVRGGAWSCNDKTLKSIFQYETPRLYRVGRREVTINGESTIDITNSYVAASAENLMNECTRSWDESLKGELDQSFNSSGKKLIELPGTENSQRSEAWRAIALDDNLLYVAGISSTESSSSHSVLFSVDVNSNGTVKTQGLFRPGTTGSVNEGFLSLIPAPDGSFLAAGKVLGSAAAKLGLAKIGSNFSLVTGFGTSGFFSDDFFSNGQANQINDMQWVGSGSNQSIFFTGEGKELYVTIYRSRPILGKIKPSGNFDTTFDTDGKVSFVLTDASHDSTGNAIAIQSDGKILLAGQNSPGSSSYAYVARVKSNGLLDTADFASPNGYKLSNFGNQQATFYKLAIQEIDGEERILCAGKTSTLTATTLGAITRLKPNGSYDNSLDLDGLLTFHGCGTDRSEVHSLLPLSDGKFLVGGICETISSRQDAFIAKFKSDGSLDTSFGTNGKLVVDFGDGSTSGEGDVFNDLVYLPDGRIAAVGRHKNAATYSYFAIAIIK